FFFQAEDGIRDRNVTGVQTCALPIYSKNFFANYFKHGTQAGGLLKLKNGQLSAEAREKMREKFQEANSGANNAGKVLVLDETMRSEERRVGKECRARRER